VLLEDIDSAGLRREELDATDAKPSSTTATVKDAKDTVRKPTDTSSPESSQGSISLSSLLNVIDGAASHEVSKSNMSVLAIQ
jgi:chaperone BCS1